MQEKIIRYFFIIDSKDEVAMRQPGRIKRILPNMTLVGHCKLSSHSISYLEYPTQDLKFQKV
jgi:hypothetical protein